MQLIRQSATTKVRLGPAVDSGDGITPETTLSIAGADQAEVLKHDGAATAAMAGTLAAVTGCDGWYDYTLTATDSGTLGLMTIVIQDSSLMLPVFKDFMVIPANAYDSLVAGSANLNADMLAISTSTTAADNLESSALTIIQGTAATGTLTDTIFTTSIGGTYGTADAILGRVILFLGDTTAALKGQAGVISSYNNTGGEITIASPLTVAPANGDSFIVV